jgi:class 3 adenylate cyclase
MAKEREKMTTSPTMTYGRSNHAAASAFLTPVPEEAPRLDESDRTGELASLWSYVPSPLIEGLLRGEDPERGVKTVSVLFIDLRGFASLVETKSADQIYAFVNRYARAISEVIHEHGGILVEFMGDGAMAVFGALGDSTREQRERAALAAARELVRTMHVLDLEVGVGVATGSAFVGSLPLADRRVWCALGNTTVLAARLQQLTRSLRAAIVADEATMLANAHAAADFRRVESVSIRGWRVHQAIHFLPLDDGSEARASRSR